MEAPDKIYLHPDIGGKEFLRPWLRRAANNESVEYVRADAFIEKAYKRLSLNLKMLMNVLDVEYDTHDTDIEDFLKDFKKYMEG